MKRIFFSLIIAALSVSGFADDKAAVVIPNDGLYVTTKAVLPKDKARLVVEGRLGKDAPEKATAVVEIKYDGKTVWSFAKSMKKDKPFVAEKTMPLAPVWAVDNPALYTASLTIYDGKTRIASRTDTFGIRTSRIAKDTGLIVNNELTRLKGLNLPADFWLHGCDRSVIKAVIKHAKDMGCNALYLEDSTLVYEAVRACDEDGMMLIADARRAVELRNHPSVVMWTAGSQTASTCIKSELTAMSDLAAATKTADPYRPVTAGLKQIDCAVSAGLADRLDILGLNAAPFRYTEAKNKSRQHLTLSLCSDFYSDEERETGTEKWVVGQFIRTNLIPIINQTDTFFIYRSLWNNTSPTLHISTSWNRSEGSHVSLIAYSNLYEGELLVNGKSAGFSRSFVWPDVQYAKGEVKVVGYNDKRQKIKTIAKSSAGDPAYIEIVPTYLGSVTFVTMRLKDKDNNYCDNAERQINIKTEGDGKLIGIALSDNYADVSAGNVTIGTYKGQVTAVIKGNATVSATADDLIGAALQINHNK